MRRRAREGIDRGKKRVGERPFNMHLYCRTRVSIISTETNNEALGAGGRRRELALWFHFPATKDRRLRLLQLRRSTMNPGL